MLDALRRPVPLPWLIAGVAIAAFAVALYCIGYAALSGGSESLSVGLSWALVNICPWLVAIEIGKRARGWPETLAVLALAFIVSMLLGFVTGASDAGFELWRRLPSLLAASAGVALLRSSVGARQNGNQDIPLLPRQIDWVRAAGNYVEMRATGQTIVHRASLSAVEQLLSGHGFIRIHRSMLVRRDRIARIRTQDVVLSDGTHLKIGKRYRAALAA